MAPTIRPRRSMSRRASVSSDSTMAKKITVTAMYQEVAIQLTIVGFVDEGNGADAVADIERDQKQRSGMNTSRIRMPVAKNRMAAASVTSS